ncbi:VirD4-like conjugal transfer protein, CD1115 family [Peribacillus frigoritolerans]|uniref:VirD4-like conjugal transfer protein, CD1115 family n=1 Tax=Peribacillus frigoritolerans TaxID=450367 RepID=UPI00203CCE67|nr:type IV secretory system conjugative DNA transfer family protein [Peribacillus frigoritolerans]MCM3169461.1 type IV secretory system conjugative DNA transfer family protein [Peribacillus frigoritolerans]
MLKVFARKDTLLIIGLLVFLCVFTLVNGIVNVVFKVIVTTLNTEDVMNPEPLNITWDTFFGLHLGSIAFYGAFALIGLVCASLVIYKLRSNFSTLENGQKGTSRFTTLDELKKQYKAVPEKKDQFEGGGGVPVSRYKKQIFIDDSPVNNLWIGTTRSGKGEIGMFSMIDIYSRAQKKASLVLNDPKGELYAASKETLEKRGYHVEVLNLMKPMESMSYQLLQLVIDAYKQKDYSNAQQLTQSISHMLYHDPSSKDKFWQESSISLCNALILAVCDKCIKENKEEQITMYSVANMLTTLGTKKLKDEETGLEIDALDDYFSKLPADNVAKMQYATLNFSAGVTRAGVLANTSSKLGIFTLDAVAKMTSKSSFDLKRIGFGRNVVGFATPLTRMNMIFSDGGVESVKTDINGRFEINFIKDMKQGDTILLEEKGNERNLQITIKEIDSDTGKVRTDIKGATEIIQVEKIEYFTKPTAVFMITPDYDASLHVIASLFVKQLYTELATKASLAKGNKCLNEVVFILDEFGNMPPIAGMESIITVCLGRNIRFNLVIQAYSQLKEKYGDGWETIDGNCGNTIYILTTDTATAEKIASKLGDATITTKSRSGGTLSLDKSKTENVDGRKLLDANELMQLKEGEMVVIRIIKRQDLKKKRITPRPIFNTGDTAMKYRWEYLTEYFDTSKSINDIDIPCLHANVDLKKLVIDFDDDSEKSAVEGFLNTLNDAIGEVAVNLEKENSSNSDMDELPFTEPESPSSPDVLDWKEMNVQTFFQNDNAIVIIENSVVNHIALQMTDIQNMNIIDFMDLLENMVEKNVLKSNIHSALKGKFKRLVNQYEGGNP